MEKCYYYTEDNRNWKTTGSISPVFSLGACSERHWQCSLAYRDLFPVQTDLSPNNMVIRRDAVAQYLLKLNAPSILVMIPAQNRNEIS
jgi:hypothetical protein